MNLWIIPGIVLALIVITLLVIGCVKFFGGGKGQM